MRSGSGVSFEKKLFSSLNDHQELREALCRLRETENGGGHGIEHSHCGECGSCFEPHPTEYLGEKDRKIEDDSRVPEDGVCECSQEVEAAETAALELAVDIGASQESLLPGVELDGPDSEDNFSDEGETGVGSATGLLLVVDDEVGDWVLDQEVEEEQRQRAEGREADLSERGLTIW